MMFKIKDKPIGGYSIEDERKWYLHGDGSVYRTAEYFPTKEDAQKVLDKFQPKHEWKHGDVLMHGGNSIMIYLEPNRRPAQIFYIAGVNAGYSAICPVSRYLENAKFMFNIKEKL